MQQDICDVGCRQVSLLQSVADELPVYLQHFHAAVLSRRDGSLELVIDSADHTVHLVGQSGFQESEHLNHPFDTVVFAHIAHHFRVNPFSLA